MTVTITARDIVIAILLLAFAGSWVVYWVDGAAYRRGYEEGAWREHAKAYESRVPLHQEIRRLTAEVEKFKEAGQP